MSKVNMSSKVTILDLQRMKTEKRPITMLTAYDYTFARLVDAAGIDVVLVGDSLGMVVQGQENTIPVTTDHIAYHGQCVARGLKRAHLVLDMPFMSYHSRQQALENAAKLMQQGRGEAVKLEGGEEVSEIIQAISRVGIPVMAHIGLTPQSVHALGGFKVQGRDSIEAEKLRRDALAVEAAGAYSVVIEGVPMELAAEITASLKIPSIGIGAGVGCDGQVLVLNDLLGLDDAFKPRFVKRYASLESVVVDAIQDFAREVQSGTFPDEQHSFKGRKERETTARTSSLRMTA